MLLGCPEFSRLESACPWRRRGLPIESRHPLGGDSRLARVAGWRRRNSIRSGARLRNRQHVVVHGPAAVAAFQAWRAAIPRCQRRRPKSRPAAPPRRALAHPIGTQVSSCSRWCSKPRERRLRSGRLGAGPRRIELKSIVSGIPGREFAEFGTVRPRVQIPGPRPKSEYDSGIAARSGWAPDHSRITIS